MEGQYVPKPNSNMVLAIFTTLCCCLPFGIVGIIKASKVSDYYVMKQYEAAQNAADEAKKWSLIGIACGIVAYIIYFVAYGATLATIISSSGNF